MLMNNLIRVGVGAMFALAATAATAQVSLKVAGLRTIALLPVIHAQEKGYFKREGLDVELIAVGAGPAVVSAVMSGSAQIGYTASVPVLFARAQGQPVRIFDAFTYETGKSADDWTWLVASQKSGVKSPKDLAGKTVALNASGAVCELLLREHLGKAGVPYESVKKIVVPFPQMQAALQLGNADAACVVEPFRTNIKISPEIKGTTIASGILVDAPHRYTLDVLFTSTAWGGAHPDELSRFNRALMSAMQDFNKDGAGFRKKITEEFKLSPAMVSMMKSDLAYTSLVASAADLKPLIDGLTRQGMLKSPMRPEDVVLEVK